MSSVDANDELHKENGWTKKKLNPKCKSVTSKAKEKYFWQKNCLFQMFVRPRSLLS